MCLFNSRRIVYIIILTLFLQFSVSCKRRTFGVTSSSPAQEKVSLQDPNWRSGSELEVALSNAFDKLAKAPVPEFQYLSESEVKAVRTAVRNMLLEIFSSKHNGLCPESFKRRLEAFILQKSSTISDRVSLIRTLERLDIFDLLVSMDGISQVSEKLLSHQLPPQVAATIRNMYEQDTGKSLAPFLKPLGSILPSNALSLYHGTGVSLMNHRPMFTGLRYGGGVFGESYTSSGSLGGVALYSVDEVNRLVAESWGLNYAKKKQLTKPSKVFRLQVSPSAIFFVPFDLAEYRDKRMWTYGNAKRGYQPLQDFAKWAQENKDKLAPLHPLVSGLIAEDPFDARIYHLLRIDGSIGEISEAKNGELEFRLHNLQIIEGKNYTEGNPENPSTVNRMLLAALKEQNEEQLAKLLGLYDLTPAIVAAAFDASVDISETRKKEWAKTAAQRMHPWFAAGLLTSKVGYDEGINWVRSWQRTIYFSDDEFQNTIMRWNNSFPFIVDRLILESSSVDEKLFLSLVDGYNNSMKNQALCTSFARHPAICLQGTKSWFASYVPQCLRNLRKSSSKAPVYFSELALRCNMIAADDAKKILREIGSLDE